MIGLGLESQAVIAMRLARAALRHPDSHRETKRMIQEKADALVAANVAAAMAAMTGGPFGAAFGALGVYRKAVRGNRRRLSRHRSR